MHSPLPLGRCTKQLLARPSASLAEAASLSTGTFPVSSTLNSKPTFLTASPTFRLSSQPTSPPPVNPSSPPPSHFSFQPSCLACSVLPNVYQDRPNHAWIMAPALDAEPNAAGNTAVNASSTPEAIKFEIDAEPNITTIPTILASPEDSKINPPAIDSEKPTFTPQPAYEQEAFTSVTVFMDCKNGLSFVKVKAMEDSLRRTFPDARITSQKSVSKTIQDETVTKRRRRE